jgi:hypothetical protein
MRRLLLAIACIALVSPALAKDRGYEVHVTPPLLPYPLPTGVPDFVVGGGSHAPITLRFAIIDGRRVLYEPVSGDVIYVLRP